MITNVERKIMKVSTRRSEKHENTRKVLNRSTCSKLFPLKYSITVFVKDNLHEEEGNSPI